MHEAKTLVKPSVQKLEGRTFTVVERNQAETTKWQSNKGEPGLALADSFDQTCHQLNCICANLFSALEACK